MKLRELIERIRYNFSPIKSYCSSNCITCPHFANCSGEAPELIEENTEYRCGICDKRFQCPAYNTGVLYPCPHFKEENYGTEE